MGDFQDYEDERNYDVFKEVYAFHKKFESYFGKYISPAEVVVISPGSWPAGEAAQEYRGIQLMLKEAHIQYDIIENSQVGNLDDKIKKYKIIILPEILQLDEKAITILSDACQQGSNLIATNHSFSDHTETLEKLFGAKIINGDHHGAGFYLSPVDKKIFKRFDKQKLLFWKFNLGLYDFTNADTTFLPILTPGRPGPLEIIGGHEPTGYYAVGLKNNELAKQSCCR